MGEQEGGRLTPQPPPITFLLLQGSQESQESESPDTLRNVTIGLGVALLLVIVIFSTIIMCTQKRCCSHHPLCLQLLPLSPPKISRGRETWGLGVRYICIQSPVTLYDPWVGHLPSQASVSSFAE